MREEDFDQEEFAYDINNELDSSDHLSNFHNYAGDNYKVHNESYENIYGDDIYVEVNYNQAIDDETLILTIKFDTNNPDFHYDKYTINGYITYEVTDALKEMLLELLDKIYKKDKNQLTKFGKDDLKYLLNKYPEDDYIKSVATGAKYKLFDYNSFINEYYLSPEEEESGEVDDFHNLAGEFKDIGEETDQSYQFFQELHEQLEEFYGELELKSCGESDLKIHLPNYADDSKFVIELNVKGIGTEDIYFHIDFDTDNEDYPVLKDTTIDNNPKDVVEKLRYLILKRYNEYYLNNKNIIKKLPDEIIDKLAIVNPEDPFFISWKGGRKFQMFDYASFVKESNQRHKADDPLWEPVKAYSSKMLNDIFDKSGIHSRDEFDLDIYEYDGDLVADINIKATIYLTKDNIPDRVKEMEVLKEKLLKAQDVLDKYPFTVKLTQNRPGGASMRFMAKIEDLMKIDSIKNHVESLKSSDKYKLFMKKDA